MSGFKTLVGREITAIEVLMHKHQRTSGECDSTNILQELANVQYFLHFFRSSYIYITFVMRRLMYKKRTKCCINKNSYGTIVILGQAFVHSNNLILLQGFFASFRQKIGPCSSMDRMEASGALDVSSNLARVTSKLKKPVCLP